jgi:DNA-binding MarR family transcriptional regulator
VSLLDLSLDGQYSLSVLDESENLPSGRSDSHLVAWRLLLTVHALFKARMDEGLKTQKGISYDDYDVLATINEAAGERLRLTELAELTLFSHSGISRCVTRLESEGLLKRERSETDGRGYYACLTRVGRNALLEMWPRYRKLIDRDFASKLTEDEAEQLAALLHRLIASSGDSRFNHVYSERLTDAPV